MVLMTGFLVGAWLLRVIKLHHIEQHLSTIPKEPRARAHGATIALMVVSLLMGVGTLAGQVVGKQGQKQFTSPMIIEVALDKFLATPKGAPWTTLETKDYVCDGVLLPALMLTAEKGDEKTINVLLITKNEGGKDKEVLAKLEIVAGERVLATALVPRFEIEEGQQKKRKSRLLLREKIEQAPILRITLTVYLD
jgi:hypothetical protein